MAWKYHILQKLQNYGIRGNMFNFIKNFIDNRRFRVKNGAYMSDVFYQENGIPQGSVLSVILFLIAINDINSAIMYPVQSLCFADDLVIFYRDRDIGNIENNLQAAILTLQTWSNNTGFRFSTSKTKCMHYKKRVPQQAQNPILTLYDHQLEFVNSLRYLGVFMDQRLNWTLHFKHVKENCNNRVNILKYLSNQGWGADLSSLMKVYKSFIRSKIEYASVAYTSAHKSSLKIIDVIYNKCLRIVSGAFHTSPTDSIYCETGELPPEFRRNNLIIKYCFRALQHKNHLLFNTIKNPHLYLSYSNLSCTRKMLPFPIIFHNILEEFEFSLNWLTNDDGNDDECEPWRIKNPEINISLASMKKEATNDSMYKMHFAKLIEEMQTSSMIYTDGSKTLARAVLSLTSKIM